MTSRNLSTRVVCADKLIHKLCVCSQVYVHPFVKRTITHYNTTYWSNTFLWVFSRPPIKCNNE